MAKTGVSLQYTTNWQYAKVNDEVTLVGNLKETLQHIEVNWAYDNRTEGMPNQMYFDGRGHLAKLGKRVHAPDLGKKDAPEFMEYYLTLTAVDTPSLANIVKEFNLVFQENKLVNNLI